MNRTARADLNHPHILQTESPQHLPTNPSHRDQQSTQDITLFFAIPPQRVLITGGTGFIGQVLVNALLDAHHSVCVLTRNPAKANHQFKGKVRCILSMNELTHTDAFDVIINLAGSPIAAGLWTTKRKQQHLASRVGTTTALLKWLSQSSHQPNLWIQASAIGFYGVRDSAEILDENAASGQGFMSELCTRWEAAAQPVDALGIRRVTLRLGVVFGSGGGALAPMLLPFKLGIGGRMGSGKQVMSWIHRDDVMQIIARAFEDKQFSGIYNAVAPEAITQQDFANKVGKLLKRPVWLPIPAAPLRMVLGEMAQLFFDGQRVVPTRLLQAGFQFRYPTVDSALRSII